MPTEFTPPRPDQWEDPRAKGRFIPPSVDSWQPAAPTTRQAAPVNASDSLLSPELADQHTTTIAQGLTEAATRPPELPAPPTPQSPSFFDRVKNVIAGPGTVAGNLTSTQQEDVPFYRQALARGSLNAIIPGLGSVAPNAAITKPIFDIPAAQAEDVAPGHPIVRGAIKGAENFAGSMTTPEQIGIMGLLPGAGKIPKVGQIVSRLVSAGFSLDMFRKAWKDVPQFREQIKAKDLEGATQTLTSIALNTAMGAGAGIHAASPRLKTGAALEKQTKPAEQEYTSTGQPIQKETTPNAVTVEQPEQGPVKAEKEGIQPPSPALERPAGEPQQSIQPSVNANAQKEGLLTPPPTNKPAESAGSAGTIGAETESGRAAGAAGPGLERVDRGPARPVDAGATGEGQPVHGTGKTGARRVAGEETDVLIPGEDRSLRARYEVRELSDVQPSHNGQTFLANEAYAHQNERDYSKPENQQRVIDNSSEERFNARYHVTDNPDATNGPIVVDEAGNALGGNSRGMILQRVYGRNGNAAGGYRGLLEKKAAQFGIDPEQVRGLKQPVLVRVVPEAELHTLPGGSKWAIRKTNVSGTAQLSAAERSAADAGQLSPDLVDHLSSAIDATGPDATLNDALTGRSGTAIVNKLIAEGFFSEQERPALMDGKTGALTQLAKDRISKAMLGRFFRDSDQISRAPAALKAKLERIAAPLSRVQGDSAWDLTPAIREAVDLTEYANGHGIKNLNDVVSQQSMFGEAPAWNTDAVRLAELLRSAKPNDLVAAVRRYANDREPTMFGASTPEEAFSQHFGGEKAQRAPAIAEQKEPVEEPTPQPVANKASAPPPVPPPPVPESESAPAKSSKADDGVYFGSGLGAFEPMFRAAKAEGDAMRAKRSEALQAAQQAAGTPDELHAGEKVRSYFTAERDLWGAKANQAIDIVTRKFVPKIEDREALGIMREFRHRPDELQQMIDGTHLIFHGDNAAVAMERRQKLLPVMRNAMRMLTNPTPKERAADIVFTNIAEESLKEGRAGGWLGSRWKSDEYVPHLLNDKTKGELPSPPSTEGRIQGNVGKFFRFGLRRSDPYPTSLHAVLNGVIPKTLDPSPAFTVHADAFSRARATHLLEEHLVRGGLGHWGESWDSPAGWVQLAKHSDEFQKDSVDENKLTGDFRIAKMGLYVPPFIEKALSPITDPDWTPKLKVSFKGREFGFANIRAAQRGLKQAILGFSGFHLLTEHAMAMADIGPSGMYRSLRGVFSRSHDVRMSPDFLHNERDFIASGGTTSIQGSVMNAYRGLQPGTIPTRAEIIRAYIPGSKHALHLADQITNLTFDNIQRRFKVVSFQLHRDAWQNDNPNANPTEFAEAKKGIASYVNGVYGGLHWENMGVPRAMVEVGRFFVLAPDWTGSNIALAKYATDSRPSRAELSIGKGQLRGAITKESAQARLARAFWTKQFVQGFAATQLMSLMLSGNISKRPFQVYLGKDKDGQDVFQNVFFRGSAGDLVNLGNKMQEHGLLTGVGVMAGGKAAPVTKLGIHILTGRDDLGRQIAPQGLNPVANTVRGVASTVSDLSPIPIVARTMARQSAGDGSDKYLWNERILSLFGPAARHLPPPGTRMTKHGLAPVRPKAGHSTWDQIVKGKP